MAYATISKPSLHFNTKLYTGTGAELAVTGVGFQPDFTWLKSRSIGEGHYILDAVRGATKFLRSNNADAEATGAQSLKSFDSDGFTIGTESDINTNNSTNVSWNWKANGAGSSNSDGTITSTVSVNTTSGFSIVKYTGSGANATIGHGLGAVPKMIIVKNLSSYNWNVYHASPGATKNMVLNEAEDQETQSYWQNTTPTSTLFSVNNDNNVNQNSTQMIAYCFAEKAGFSKFGQYIGNGSNDGMFIYTGFKPAFVMVKDYTANGYNWMMYDDKRLGYNVDNKHLVANNSSSEAGGASDNPVDLLSNGFKFRIANQNTNRSDSYLYMAFASEPLVANVGSSIPATAR